VKKRKKLITVIGARPQIIKSSAITRWLALHYTDTIHEVVVHTGQHYDANMSAIFFQEMNIPQPHHNLQVKSSFHGQQTAQMLESLERIFIAEQPDAVLVYGDTNSTLSGTLAATKLNIPLIHVEAGLRSFDKTMPEEINRIACDHLSTLLFVPTKSAVENLRREGFTTEHNYKTSINHPKIYHCGDIMHDNSLYYSTFSDKQSTICKKLTIQNADFILCTIHRAINTDNVDRLSDILEALITIQHISEKKIVFPIHPRTKNKLFQLACIDKIKDNSHLIITDPVGFLDMIALEKRASMVITDSGGVQKEAFFFQKPSIILRKETEWTEIVTNGNAILADAHIPTIIAAYRTLSTKNDFSYPPFYGDGSTAAFICDKIVRYLS